MNQNIPLQIVGGSTFGRYPKISLATTTNMMISDNALVPYAGYIVAKEQAGIEARGMYKSINQNILIRIIDNRVFVVDSALNHQQVASLNTYSGDCYIVENSANPTQFLISDLSYLYLYIYGVSFQVLGAAQGVNFTPGWVDYQDGYFLCPDTNSNQWHLSHLNDGTNWQSPDVTDGLTYVGEFQTKPDLCQAVVQFNRLLFVMAKTGTEIWRDTGTLLFPYQRDNSVSIDLGVLSISTIAVGFGILCWVAQNEKSNPTILTSMGGEPQPISTDGIDYLLGQLTNPADSDAFMFQEDGHVFYQVTFFTDNLTIVYDFDNKKFYNLTDENYNHHIAKLSVFYNNVNYFNSYSDANLYQFSSSFTTYNGAVIPRIRVCPPVRFPGARRFKGKRITLTMEQGQCQELQKVILFSSIDGGMSFGNGFEVPCNAPGYGANRMNFYQLGAANDFTFRFEFWSQEPIPPILELNGPLIVADNGNLQDRFVITDAELEIG